MNLENQSVTNSYSSLNIVTHPNVKQNMASKEEWSLDVELIGILDSHKRKAILKEQSSFMMWSSTGSFRVCLAGSASALKMLLKSPLKARMTHADDSITS